MTRKRAASAAPAATLSLSDVIQSLFLVSVRLSKLAVNATRADELQRLDDTTVGINTMASTVGRGAEHAVFSLGVRVWVPQGSPPAEAPVVIQCERLLTYAGVPAGASDEVLADFCRGSVPLAGWPYLRRDVHAACQEADLPPILLPLVKAPDLIPRQDVEAGKSSPAWAAFQPRLVEALETLAEQFDLQREGSLYRQIEGASTDGSWGLAVRAAHAQYLSLKRRLSMSVRTPEIRPLLAELWDFASLVQQLLETRVQPLREHHAEVLTRWDEFAADMERLFRAAEKTGAFSAEVDLRLRRLAR